MRNLLVIIGAALISVSITTASIAGSIGFGITGNATTLDTSGSQTLKDTAGVTSASIEEDVTIPEIFMEFTTDNNVAFGVSYVPVQQLGKSARTDTDLETVTNTAEAELESLIRVYLDVPLAYGVYATGGISNTTIVTKESLGTGSSYDDENVFGYSLGLGFRGDIGDSGMYYKAEYLWSEYDSYEDTSGGNGNKITADTEATSAKLSIAYGF